MFYLFFFLLIPRPPTSTLFPYTTLFRSRKLQLNTAKLLRQDKAAKRTKNTVTEPEATLRVCRLRRWRFVAENRSEEHTSELQSRVDLVCRLLLEKKKKKKKKNRYNVTNS